MSGLRTEPRQNGYESSSRSREPTCAEPATQRGAWAWIEPGQRPAALVALAALALGLYLSLKSAPMWWFGSALWVSSGTALWSLTRPGLLALGQRMGRARTWGPVRVVPACVFGELAVVSAVLLLTCMMMGEVAAGARPVSHDHPVHYFKAWQLHQHLLPEGRLLGWSHRWFAGYPANYLYPPLADLWVNAVYWLGLGWLSFGQAYGIAIWLFYAFVGYALYHFGHRVAGPGVGLIAAVAYLTDLSAFRYGGWTYAVLFGVWPQSLSLGFGLLALARVPRLATSHSWGPVASFGLWFGLAVLAHPMQLVFVPIVLVVLAVAAIYSERVFAAAAVVRLLLATGLGLLLAAAWLLPFLSARRFVTAMGLWWKTGFQLGWGLLQLDMFEGTVGLVVAFGLLGVVGMLRSRDLPLMFTALMALFVPAVSTSTFVDELHLPALSSAFSKVQFVRMSTMAKPFWFVAAAFLVVAVWRRLPVLLRPAGGGLRKPDTLWRRAAFLFGLTALLSPIVVGFGQAYWSSHLERSIKVAERDPLRHRRREFVRWAKQALPRSPFYRIAVFPLHAHDHSLLDLATEVDLPFYKVGFTPCANFAYKLGRGDRETLRAVNVRFALSLKGLRKSDFELLRSFGPLKLYRFKHWNPEPFELLEGAGPVVVERFSDEEIVLRAGRGAFGSMRLNVSYFPHWRATLDGRPVRTMATRLEQGSANSGFLTVTLHPGLYRFVFKRHALDWLGALLTLAGAAVFALLMLAEHRPRALAGYRVLDRLRDLSRRLSRRAESLSATALGRIHLWAGAGLLAVAMAAGLALGLWEPSVRIPRSVSQKRVEGVRYDFTERVGDARASVNYGRTKLPCREYKERLVCPNRKGEVVAWHYVASEPAVLESYGMARCLRATPLNGGTIELVYRDVPVGEALAGYYGVPSTPILNSRERFDFSVRVGDEVVHKGRIKPGGSRKWLMETLRSHAPGSRADVTFTVRARPAHRHKFCFHLQMVDLEQG